MTIARIENGAIAEVRNLSLEDVPEHKRHQWKPVEGFPPPFDPETHVLTGPDIAVEPERVSRTYKVEQRTFAVLDYEVALEDHIERLAKVRGYKSEASLLSYLASTNPAWAAEARVFAAWRDEVWTTAYAILAEVKSGVRAPSATEFLALLPPIRWPDKFFRHFL